MAIAGRDDQGRFARGNRASLGRAPRKKELAYLKALTDAVTPQKWLQIVEKAIADAVAGDRHAREWVANYLVGRPALTLDLPAADQVLLNELLAELDARNVPASDLFESMLNQLADNDDEQA